MVNTEYVCMLQHCVPSTIMWPYHETFNKMHLPLHAFAFGQLLYQASSHYSWMWSLISNDFLCFCFSLVSLFFQGIIKVSPIDDSLSTYIWSHIINAINLCGYLDMMKLKKRQDCLLQCSVLSTLMIVCPSYAALMNKDYKLCNPEEMHGSLAKKGI